MAKCLEEFENEIKKSKGQDDWDKNTNTFLVDISAASRSI